MLENGRFSIYKLKQRILALSSKMSVSFSTVFGGAGRSSGTITELCSRINEDVARIRSLSTSEEINKSLHNILVYQGQISVFADGLEVDHAKNRIECNTRIENLEKAVKGYREELEIEREKKFHIKDISDGRAHEITTLENEIWQLKESLEGAKHDIEDKEYGINDLLVRIQAIDGERERLQEEVDKAIELIGTYDRWAGEYRKNYDELREVATSIVQADQHNIRRLKKIIAVLKIQNQWRHFRFLNAPLNPLLPVP
jgi:chromosome segregation ATPase